jgi:hypothetical protein
MSKRRALQDVGIPDDTITCLSEDNSPYGRVPSLAKLVARARFRGQAEEGQTDEELIEEYVQLSATDKDEDLWYIFTSLSEAMYDVVETDEERAEIDAIEAMA